MTQEAIIIPDQIRGNSLSRILDRLLKKYARLTTTGRIYGLALADQDAKILAVNTFFDTDFNYWDIGSIGAALYGVAKQAQDFFHAAALDRASLIFNDRQFFVHKIGKIRLSLGKERELILIVIAKDLNIGLIIMLMKQIADNIQLTVELDETAQTTMQMSEQEFQSHIQSIKMALFSQGETAAND
jgi:predicted regulator of Ras-like GTPase activity (Roadblock/LC7/MglB family)